MANHKSSKKRIRQEAKRRLQNRFFKKGARMAIKKLRAMTTQSEAAQVLPKVISMIDKLAKTNQFHPNKASNLKSKLTRFVAKLA